MLIYVIALCTITFCDANDTRITENYNQLVLVQRFSITNIFYDEVRRPDVNTKSAKFMKYLANHKELFQAKSWVLQGLWPLDSDNKLLKNCVTSTLKQLSLNYNKLEGNLKSDLKKEWPVLTIKETDKNNMKTEYNKYGSCVTKSASAYFKKALELFGNYNLTNILDRLNIRPGGEYSPFYIENKIQGVLGTIPVVDCLDPRYMNTEDKFLLQIQLCFDVKDNLMNCQHGKELSKDYSCDSKKERSTNFIQYPLLPADYHLLIHSL